MPQPSVTSNQESKIGHTLRLGSFAILSFARQSEQQSHHGHAKNSKITKIVLHCPVMLPEQQFKKLQRLTSCVLDKGYASGNCQDQFWVPKKPPHMTVTLSESL